MRNNRQQKETHRKSGAEIFIYKHDYEITIMAMLFFKKKIKKHMLETRNYKGRQSRFEKDTDRAYKLKIKK